MKCPKCSYIGFEPSDRCRNCGFDFSLAATGPPASDLPLRQTPRGEPLADFDLRDSLHMEKSAAKDRVADGRGGGSRETATTARTGGSLPGDLPLFGDDSLDDVPLVRPSAPAAPLAVRRSTPSRPRSTPAPRVATRPPDPGLPLEVPAAANNVGPKVTSGAAASEAVTIGRRIGAAALDWVLLLALDAGVIYFTLRVSRLAATQVTLLPPAPMAAFLLLMDGGYLTLFTAATGQTIGKMAFGLRVVRSQDEPLSIGRALARTAALIVSALPGGLGLLPAAFDSRGRGLHDRVAGTRVVRAA